MAKTRKDRIKDKVGYGEDSTVGHPYPKELGRTEARELLCDWSYTNWFNSSKSLIQQVLVKFLPSFAYATFIATKGL